MNKLCVDCKHFVRNDDEWASEPYRTRYATCALTARVSRSLGERCERRRTSFFDKCGANGKQWEQRDAAPSVPEEKK